MIIVKEKTSLLLSKLKVAKVSFDQLLLMLKMEVKLKYLQLNLFFYDKLHGCKWFCTLFGP
jgi:hypothetical protein